MAEQKAAMARASVGWACYTGDIDMYTEDLPTRPGPYSHRWIGPDKKMREHVLFVGWVAPEQPRCQGVKNPNTPLA